jgi:hypothetical protein
MVETAAHLTDHVFPRLPVRQWVLSVPKRLRIFLRVIVQSLQTHSSGAAQLDKATMHIGAVALANPQVHIHRFGSSLNGHLLGH